MGFNIHFANTEPLKLPGTCIRSERTAKFTFTRPLRIPSLLQSSLVAGRGGLPNALYPVLIRVIRECPLLPHQHLKHRRIVLSFEGFQAPDGQVGSRAEPRCARLCTPTRLIIPTKAGQPSVLPPWLSYNEILS